MLHSVALVCNNLSCLGYQQSYIDGSGAGGGLDAGVHASCTSTVGSRVDSDAQFQPVVLKATTCSLLGLASGSYEGIAGINAGFWL